MPLLPSTHPLWTLSPLDRAELFKRRFDDAAAKASTTAREAVLGKTPLGRRFEDAVASAGLDITDVVGPLPLDWKPHTAGNEPAKAAKPKRAMKRKRRHHQSADAGGAADVNTVIQVDASPVKGATAEAESSAEGFNEEMRAEGGEAKLAGVCCNTLAVLQPESNVRAAGGEGALPQRAVTLLALPSVTSLDGGGDCDDIDGQPLYSDDDTQKQSAEDSPEKKECNDGLGEAQ